MISCGNRGPIPKEGQAATADGTIIDLKEIGSSIRGVADFVMNVEEVKSLISSIDELAKGIGKKINSASGDLAVEGSHNNKNNGLMAGVYQIALLIESKAKSLQVGESFKDKALQAKVETVKKSAGDFKNKLATQHSDLGSSGSAVQDTNAKQAIDRKAHGTDGTHGAKELSALHTAVTELIGVANEVLGRVISPAKEVTPAQNKR